MQVKRLHPNARLPEYGSADAAGADLRVCLDAPAGRDDPAVTGGAVEIPVRQVEQPELTPAQEPELPAAYYIPYTLGVLIAVGAVWLLARRFLPKQRKRL